VLLRINVATQKRNAPARQAGSSSKAPSTSPKSAVPVVRKPKPKTFTLSRSVLMAGEEKMLELKRADVPTSWSALVEVALLELFKHHDLAAVVGRHGIGLRRK
jgi:hypothetical protein